MAMLASVPASGCSVTVKSIASILSGHMPELLAVRVRVTVVPTSDASGTYSAFTTVASVKFPFPLWVQSRLSKPDAEAPATVYGMASHIASSAPASTMGCWSFVITTSSKDSVQDPLAMVHLSVAELPAGSPLTPLVGSLALTMVSAGPAVCVHVPVPTAGELAAMVKSGVPHCGMSGPASAFVGSSKKLTVISSNPEHDPFASVHRKV